MQVRQEGALLQKRVEAELALLLNPNTLTPGPCAQVRQEGALLQKRAEAAEAELGAQRAAHRRDLRRSARELADAQARP